MKKRLIFLTGLCLAAIFSGGCENKETEAPVEITLMHGWGGTLQTHKIMQEIYEDFNRQNPDIVLTSISYSDNTIAVNKANDMLAVGKAPDILSTNGLSYYLINAVKSDAAMDLMPYIEQDPKWKEQIHPSVFDTWMTEEGELYTIPDALEMAGYWYNESYFRRAGITDEEGNVQIPKTWDEFAEMIQQLQIWIDEQKLGVTVFALEEEQMMEFLFLARLAGESQEGLRAAISSEPVLEDSLLYTVQQDLETMQQYSRAVNSIEDARQSFRNGSAIIYFNGVWEADELEKGMIDNYLKYANYPTCNGLSLSYVSSSSGYVLSKQTDERKADACIRFLKYMQSEAVQEKIALWTGQAPSNPNIDKSVLAEESPLLWQALEVTENADIQIETVRSVWDEQYMEMLQELIKEEE